MQQNWRWQQFKGNSQWKLSYKRMDLISIPVVKLCYSLVYCVWNWNCYKSSELNCSILLLNGQNKIFDVESYKDINHWSSSSWVKQPSDTLQWYAETETNQTFKQRKLLSIYFMLPALGKKKSKGKIILVLQNSKGLYHWEE